MKFKDILEKATDDTWIQLDIRLCNVTFSAKYSASFFKNDDFAKFMEKAIESIRVDDGVMILKL